jgi:aspartyl-tRNA(Asn)/glutamyl-tRNA(Gln) amidotransferase subunit C
MEVTEELINHVANLARLELTPEEKQAYLTEFPNILNLVAQLNDLDTSALPASPVNWTSGLPDDATCPTCPDGSETYAKLAECMANGPETEDGYFAVPKILDN